MKIKNELPQVNISDFEVGNIAYVIPFWNEFGRVYKNVYPVEILKVGRINVKTTNIQRSLKNTGVGDNRKTLDFKISIRKIYCESSRFKERAKLHGEILSKTSLELKKQNSNSTILFPSIEYVGYFVKHMGFNQFIIGDMTYNIE